ncbi:cupin domain-containing protein [Oceanomicrobium pacificus]|uniref:Cupin domain-containing protein n=1 Tax=Oceanomicrobium pacificus TaxID=2692916 RepID=A0A6B0TV72_9RHOB|nr:cupin domain-containing protein [Oceanomicrobium pacificus]MXU65112.1 cupin domain-containing protein [Oceanomicrobium pacificus]
MAKDGHSDWVVTGPGARRRVLSDSPDLMLVLFDFEEGAVGPIHQHPHVQGTYVASGRFLFEVDGEERELNPGDSLVIPGDTPHGCTALEAGQLVDSFTPRRDDFL